MRKLFIHSSILNIFLSISQNLMPCDARFLYTNKHKKKIKLNFQNNHFYTTNLIVKLSKIGKNKIIHAVENIILKWLICLHINNLHNYFIIEAFLDYLFHRTFVIILSKNIMWHIEGYHCYSYNNNMMRKPKGLMLSWDRELLTSTIQEIVRALFQTC